MRILRRQDYVSYWILPTSISLTLLTNFRFTENIGAGELGIFLFSVLSISKFLLSRKKINKISRVQACAFLAVAYIVVIMLPVTLLGMLVDNGAGIRGYAAVIFSALFFLGLSLSDIDNYAVARRISVTLIIIMTLGYFFGGGSFWYSERFTSGAENPNQLALYVSCAMFFGVFSFYGIWKRTLLILIYAFFGVLSVSDAFHLFLVCFVVFFFVSRSIPRKIISVALPIFVIMLFILFLFYSSRVDNFAAATWAAADQGYSRLTLAYNGILAWLHTPFSIILGNGIGAFSGVLGPFEGAEAHNTAVDILSMGGLSAFFLFYGLLVKSSYSLYRYNEFAFFSLFSSLIIFSLFHLIIRQPVFWFSIYFAIRIVAEKKNLPSSVIVKEYDDGPTRNVA